MQPWTVAAELAGFSDTMTEMCSLCVYAFVQLFSYCLSSCRRLNAVHGSVCVLCLASSKANGGHTVGRDSCNSGMQQKPVTMTELSASAVRVYERIRVHVDQLPSSSLVWPAPVGPAPPFAVRRRSGNSLEFKIQAHTSNAPPASTHPAPYRSSRGNRTPAHVQI